MKYFPIVFTLYISLNAVACSFHPSDWVDIIDRDQLPFNQKELREFCSSVSIDGSLNYSIDDQTEYTPFMYAAYKGSNNLNRLIEVCKVDINYKNKKHTTALKAAFEADLIGKPYLFSGAYHTILTLIMEGADVGELPSWKFTGKKLNAYNYIKSIYFEHDDKQPDKIDENDIFNLAYEVKRKDLLMLLEKIIINPGFNYKKHAETLFNKNWHILEIAQKILEDNQKKKIIQQRLVAAQRRQASQRASGSKRSMWTDSDLQLLDGWLKNTTNKLTR